MPGAAPVSGVRQRRRQLVPARAELRGNTASEGDDVPRFMDYHDDLKLPPEAIEQIAQGARDGATDEFGVRQVELFHNSDGNVYCLLDGPDAEAIRRHHAALNVPCGEVHQVSSLL